MTAIRIIHKSNNLELVSKLMNSVAAKYNCRVKYNKEKKDLDFFGNESYRQFIAEETLGLFAKAA